MCIERCDDMRTLRKRAIAKSFGFKYLCLKGESVMKTRNITSHYGGELTDKEFLNIVKLKAKMFKVC